jgi:hypothetical protein
MASTSWFNIIPHSQWGKTAPSGILAVGVTTGSTEYNVINTDLNGTGFSYKGSTYDLWNGPFTSSAEAQQNVNGASGWTIAGIVGASAIQGLTSGAGPSVAQGASAGTAVGKSVSSVTDFLSDLTAANLWIRVAKVAIGGIILIVGLAQLTGIEKGIVGTTVKAAPLL